MRGPDRLLRALARLVLKAFFREVETAGAERIPLHRPLGLVANHVNGLIDPILLLGPLPVLPRFLAKSTLWKNPLVRPFLDLAGAIPVYRRQDEGSDPAKNAETFSRSHELLAQGGALALFPRGAEPQRSRAQAAQDRRRADRPGGGEEIPRPGGPDRPRRPPLRRQADLPLARPGAGGAAARPGAGDRPGRPGSGRRRPPAHRPHRRGAPRGHPQLRDLGGRPSGRPRRGPLPPPRPYAADPGEPGRGGGLPPRLPGGVPGPADETPGESRRRGRLRPRVRRAPGGLPPPGRSGGSGLPALAGGALRGPHPAEAAGPSPAGGDRDPPQLSHLPSDRGDREAGHPRPRPDRHLQSL